MMSSMYQGYASAAFGLEGLVAAELRKYGYAQVRSENGGVRFEADMTGIFRLNLLSRFSDRIYLLMADVSCRTFEELYQAVLKVDWETFFPENGAVNIACKCVRSTLMSPRDCQSVAKKAVLNRLRERAGLRVFPESGAPLPVQLSLRNDRLMILLNTSGDALSRRGYRTWNGEAPLRETLAAALVDLSPWKPGMPLHDPCCGTGTLLIEAALMAAGRAPGIYRSFAMEGWKDMDSKGLQALRQAESEKEQPEAVLNISGSDLDPEALKLAERHLRQARLPQHAVSLSCQPLQELHLDAEDGVFICNPPYGERLSDQKNCRKLYRDLHELRKRHPSWKLCAISSDPAFERSYGGRADKKRRLYNGRLECVFYMYD